MRARALPLFLTAAAMTVACGRSVTVQVLPRSAQDSVATPAKDIPVEFLPYDRDSIFDALTRRASEPQPQVPDDLKAEKQQVADLNQTWHAAETAWSDKRDDLQKLSADLQKLDRRDPKYLPLYKRFNALDAEVSRLDTRKKRLFASFDSLQKLTIERSDSMRAVENTWADQAFAPYTSIVDSLLKQRGKKVVADTTDGQGYATGHMKGAPWYVYARYTLPFEELYWNIRIDTMKSDTLKLTRENAQVRLKM
ncbi:MAG: hypothetical protein Q8W51_08555 [Candidatus Palauibacterales bacterium]|nr:hypothetical protein [Candidatus Palauibacterales bacterium]MDP2529776.1 hypothetical protein [Candidatus Palauibacterales bacterium]MDP2585131.1 hypothetical protein [Candidatus Palauibacterales bacterium]